MIGIYAIISPSKRIYIGQSIDDIKARWKMHKQCRKSGCTLLNNSIKKYGFDAHELKVLHELPKDVSQEVINEYELFYWQQYKDCGFSMLNLMIPGNSSKHSDETKSKISESLKGNKYAVGYKHTEETKAKISKTSTGRKYLNRKVSDAVLANIKRLAELNKGKKMPPEAVEKSRQARIGYKFSDEVKKKMSDAAKGKVLSDVTKEKISSYQKTVVKTEEWKKKIGLGQLGNKRSPEAIANMRKARWGK